MTRWIVVFLLALPMVSSPAFGIDESERFEDPGLQARYEALIDEIRCLVCQNQTIADSNAGLAADLRREVREMFAEGATEEQIAEFLVDRYGDFVLYRPPLKPTTWLLWAGPALLVGLGLIVFTVTLLRRSAQPLDQDGD